MSWRDITGWHSSEPEYEEIVRRAPMSTQSNFVEVGLAFGRSIAQLATLVVDSGKPINIVGIDSFLEIMGQEQPDKQWVGGKYANAREAFESMMRMHAPIARLAIDVWQCTSLQGAARCDDKSLDFVFIDANHDYEHVRADIAAWLPKVKPGGVIAGDDFSYNMFPGVVRAVQEAFGVIGWRVRGVTWWVNVPS